MVFVYFSLIINAVAGDESSADVRYYISQRIALAIAEDCYILLVPFLLSVFLLSPHFLCLPAFKLTIILP